MEYYSTGVFFSFRPINLFSLSDLEEGKISFVHTGALASRLALRVSDGQRVSNLLVFAINPEVECLEINIVKNALTKLL